MLGVAEPNNREDRFNISLMYKQSSINVKLSMNVKFLVLFIHFVSHMRLMLQHIDIVLTGAFMFTLKFHSHSKTFNRVVKNCRVKNEKLFVKRVLRNMSYQRVTAFLEKNTRWPWKKNSREYTHYIHTDLARRIKILHKLVVATK